MLASDLLKREWTVESGEKLEDAVLSAVEFVLVGDPVEEMDDVGVAEQVDRDARVGFEQDACILTNTFLIKLDQVLRVLQSRLEDRSRMNRPIVRIGRKKLNIRQTPNFCITSSLHKRGPVGVRSRPAQASSLW